MAEFILLGLGILLGALGYPFVSTLRINKEWGKILAEKKRIEQLEMVKRGRYIRTILTMDTVKNNLNVDSSYWIQ